MLQLHIFIYRLSINHSIIRVNVYIDQLPDAASLLEERIYNTQEFWHTYLLHMCFQFIV